METCNATIPVLSDKSPYMNDSHLDYFKYKLLSQRRDISLKIEESREKIKTMKSTQADIIDRSNTMIDFEAAVAAGHRYSSLLKEIDRALERIAEQTYGFCCISGEPIGLKRLDILPCTTVSIAALSRAEEDQE